MKKVFIPTLLAMVLCGFAFADPIVTITFNVTSIGDSKLDLETQLYDYPPPDREPRISWPIEHQTIDGSFNIIPEFSITTMIFLLMVLTGFVILLSRISRKRSLPHDSPFRKKLINTSHKVYSILRIVK